MKALIALAALAALPCYAGLAEDYPGPWRSDAPAEISRTLAANQVADCAQFSYRQRASGAQEYLVYCSRDGKRWTAWIAWTASRKVMGPYRPDAALPPPG